MELISINNMGNKLSQVKLPSTKPTELPISKTLSNSTLLSLAIIVQLIMEGWLDSGGM